MNQRTFEYTGLGPMNKDLRKGGKQTGELMPGEQVVAWPLYPEHPGFLWRVTNPRNGFTMLSPKQDLKEMHR